MLKLTLPVVMLALLFAGCGASPVSKDVFYVQSGVASFYTAGKDKLNWDSNIYWGYKYLGVSLTNNITNIDGTPYAAVVSALNKDKKGFIRLSDLVINPVSPGVILNKVLVREEPSFRSGKKAFVTPPTLVFVIKTNSNAEGLWAQVIPYRPKENYFNDPDYKQMDYLKTYYIEYKHISTKRDDIELISGTLVSVRTFNSSQNEDKIAIADTEINEIINRYPDSPAILFSRQVLEYINPAAYQSQNNPGDTNSGNPLLDEDLSVPDDTDLESDPGIISTDEL